VLGTVHEMRSINGVADPLAAPHERTVAIVAELRQARKRLESSPSARVLAPMIRALRRIECRLDRPTRLALVGEFNSGKSSLANLLARTESLPTAVVSNTRIPTLLCYASEPKICAVDERGRREWLRADQRTLPPSILRLEVGLPTPRLRSIEILDLPGYADPRFHGPGIDAGAHDVHAMLWCTMSTQAWRESERTAWGELPAHLRARGLMVATHADLLHDPRDTGKLLHRLRGEGSGLFKDIVLVSTLEALDLSRRRREDRAGEAWKATGADALETALYQLLLELRDQRAEAALRITSKIAERALSQLRGLPA
jgi:Dynamin family